jgi:hypothetical protein
MLFNVGILPHATFDILGERLGVVVNFHEFHPPSVISKKSTGSESYRWR